MCWVRRIADYNGFRMTTIPLASGYRRGVWIALAIQFLSALVLLTILDGGRLARLGAVAMTGFWLGALLIVLRRPRSPSKVDLLYFRWGFPALLFAAIVLSPLTGVLRR